MLSYERRSKIQNPKSPLFPEPMPPGSFPDSRRKTVYSHNIPIPMLPLRQRRDLFILRELAQAVSAILMEIF